MFNLIRVDHSLLEPNQQYVQNKVIRAANVQTSIWTTRRHLLHFCKVCLPFGNLIIYSDTRHNRTKCAKTFEPKVMAWGTTLEEHTTLNSSFTTVSCSRSLSIRFHSQPGHLSKGTLKTETRITLKSHQTHGSAAFLFQIWREQTLRPSQVPACFAISNDIMHRHEQTHLSVFRNRAELRTRIFMNSTHINPSLSWFEPISAYLPPYRSSSCDNGTLLC